MQRKPTPPNPELEALVEELIDLRVRRVLLSEELKPSVEKIESVSRRIAEIERLVAKRSPKRYA
jgi:hypothetical protein